MVILEGSDSSGFVREVLAGEHIALPYPGPGFLYRPLKGRLKHQGDC